MSGVKTAIRLSGEKGRAARQMSEGARKKGWGDRQVGGDGKVRRWQSVWEETERMERERKQRRNTVRLRGRWGGRERVKESQLCIAKENRRCAKGLSMLSGFVTAQERGGLVAAKCAGQEEHLIS